MTPKATSDKKPERKKPTSGRSSVEEKTVQEDPRAKGKTDPYHPRQGYFEFVVLSYSDLIPGQEGYDPKKDHLVMGFQFGGSTVPGWMPSEVKSIKDITAYDFLTNPKTGLRQGQKEKPDGAMVTSLDKGINSWTDIPPLWIWNKGDWLADLLEEENNGFDEKELPLYFQKKIIDSLREDEGKQGIPFELFPYWVTSGEGTTGNYVYRIFKLPDEIASSTFAKHPQLWRKELKKTWYGSTGYTDFGVNSGGNKKKDPPLKSSSLPFGVRIRCGGCGHWFKENDLPGHAQVCDPTGSADWAIMCCDECGCRTLDEVAKPKEGFPRESWTKAQEAKRNAKKENEEKEKEDPSSTKAVADKREEEEGVKK